jgi:hypothetical protein
VTPHEDCIGERADVVAYVATSKAALQEAERTRAEAHEKLAAGRSDVQHLLALSYQFLCLASLLAAPTSGDRAAVADRGSATG